MSKDDKSPGNSSDNTGDEFHLAVTQECRALELLRDNTGIQSQLLKQAAHFGCVWLESGSKPKRLRRLKKTLKIGDQVHLYFDEQTLAATLPEAICIADEGDFSIWFKPRGMFSQGSKWGDAHSIARFVELKLKRATFLVHRLDRMTAGLMILAHRRKLVQEFTELFKHRTIEKTYFAVVAGRPETEHFISNEVLDDRPAETECWLEEYDDINDRSLVRVLLKTGRKHQIRRHLAGKGLPIIGDRLHGSGPCDTDLQLVSAQLLFKNPVSGKESNYQLSDEMLSRELIMLPNRSGS